MLWSSDVHLHKIKRNHCCFPDTLSSYSTYTLTSHAYDAQLIYIYRPLYGSGRSQSPCASPTRQTIEINTNK